MPLKGLRPNRSERDLKRRSTLDPAGLFKRGDKHLQVNKSAEHLAAERGAVSQDGGRPASSDVRPSEESTVERPPSPPVQEHTPNTRRFSMMRFRHASDSQLSTKAKEQAAAEEAPPVPAMPMQTPAIITTAPTVVDQEDPAPKKRGRLQQFNLRRRSFDPSAGDRPSMLRKSTDKKTSMDIKRSPFSFMKSQNTVQAEPGRLSTSQRPGTLAESAHAGPQEATSTLSLPVPRASDSSRSDGSSTGHVSFENTPKPPTTRTGSGRFTFGRRNKQRQSLFPLPMKIPPPEFPDTAPATPRASTSGISSGSPHHSPGGESPPLTAINHHRLQASEDGSRTPPIPSPSQVALAAAAVNLASPGLGSLFRNDSTKSIRSSRSSPNAAPMRLGLRGRSSTMGSLGGRSDDVPPPTPPYAASGRNSTSTAGRSSFSNLFGLSARFRQNSEPHSPRHGSPAHGFSGTSGLSSHQNSMNISREALVLPEREEGETPGRYLERIEENTLDKSIIASYLTKTDDPFMLSVLRSYMRKFAFFGDPIDMAIRKLLMQVELPKETQQIDRVLQGFSDRYHECNPGIFINPDKAYFISFSIVILHTDFFNKNNKRKMSRADYIKNSSCEGVSEDVLGCVYDNIVYTPFIHVEDDLDLRAVTSRRSKKTAVLKGPMNSINDPAKRAIREPIDPYTLIFEGKLDALRPTIKDVMNLDDPYSYLGTAQALDTKTLYKSFSKYGVIQIVSSRSRPEAFMSEAAQENPLETSVGIVEMPITKVGVLWRKDAKKKKARSPWQEWGAVLTRSGLSLFKNSSWAKNLMHQHEQHQKQGNSGAVVFHPPLQEFKQDHMIPVDRAVALVDNTYKKHKHAFIISSKVGEETFLADNETDLNDWLGLLNYSATFETLGVRPRGLVGGLYEGQRNRGIRRLDSSHSGKSVPTATGDVTIQSGKIDTQFAFEVMTARRELMTQRISESEEKLTQSIKQLEARLRDARHLQILAPIQPKTRELVIHAAGRLSAKLKWARIEIWKMKCHRDILAHELEEEKQTATERQARIDRIAATSQTSQPQLSPQPSKEHRSSRISGLARLSSKASSLASGTKPPLSPALSSARPGTKSSRETEFGGDDVYKTPPETSRQSSPNQPSAQFTYPPVAFNPQSSHHRSSFTSSATHSPRLIPQEYRHSVSTTGDGAITSDEESDTEERFATPPPPIDGQKDSDKVAPKTPERPPIDVIHLDHDSGSEGDHPPAALTGSPESRSKARRSLHRTLRDSHGSSRHRRSHRGRDSASTVVSDDTQESEGLSRAKGSFTVHGKKASVVTFGTEWHNMPAEERLKARKQAQEALEENGSVTDKEGTDGGTPSVISDGTATILSAPTINEPEDTTPRPSATEVHKQRHVSSQTITPANYRESLNGLHSDSDEDSQMSEIEEESPTKDRPASKQKNTEDGDSGSEHLKMDVPRSQAVEA
ncbi:protein transport protein sec73 [Lophiotrema nucula]|uniref:Protein transport protein sec73 n=1 Tax=Lophiotrema nucula TaxID=690887 RepID=A0A6A5YJL6_9PLEO|nr:protein transport protein sec73 [Lophiotrema nucula]